MRTKILFFLLALVTSLSAYSFPYTYKGTTLEYQLEGNGDSQYAIVTQSSTKPSGAVEIPESVEYEGKSYSVRAFGMYAFKDCVSLTSVKIPNTIANIGYKAFHSCRNLTSVEIPNSLTTIESQAFYSCISLTSVEIPNSVTTIQSQAFYSCSSLTSVEIPNSVTTIGSGAFGQCTSLANVKLPNNIKTLDCFNGCRSLTAIEIPSSVTTIGGFSDTGLTSIEIPSSVTTIESNAFNGCRLTSVEIPNSVSSIGNYAFNCCNSLTSVGIPNSVTSIGDYAFQRCENLKYLFIPSSVEYVGKEALALYSYSKVVAPKSLKIGTLGYLTFLTEYDPEDILIEDGVVYNASKTSLFAAAPSVKGAYTIPNSVTTISNGAFTNCSEITSVTIPNSVASIGLGTFSYCNGLTSVEIPNSVKTIGQYAFEKCESLASINIPNSVTTIGDGAFKNCSDLTYLVIPNSVTTIGSFAFGYCSGLKSVIVPPYMRTDSYSFEMFYEVPAKIAYPNTITLSDISGPQITYDPNDVTIEDGVVYDSAKTKLLFASCDIAGSFCVPNTVTHIGAHAFLNCTELTSIFIPGSAKTYGEGAFDGCYYWNGVTNLKKIVYPWEFTCEEGSNLLESNYGTDLITYDPELAKDITVENGVVYGNGKTNLLFVPVECTDSFTIPSSVTTINDYAFHGCTLLTSLSIPDQVTTIGYNVFGCYNLKVLELGAGVEKIGYLSVPVSKLKVHAIIPPKLSGLSLRADATIEIIKDYYPRYYVADVWKDFVGHMGFEKQFEIEVPADELVIPAADMAREELTLADPNTGRVYKVDAYGMTSEAPFLYIKDHQVLPVNTLNENGQSVGEGVDTKFVLPSRLIFTDKQPEGAAPVGENMMWICDAVDPDAPAGVRYFDLPVAGAHLNVADAKTGRIYAATAHGLNTDGPILHISNFETLPAGEGSSETAKRFVVPAQLTFTNKAPEAVSASLAGKAMLWACDSVAEAAGSDQYFSIPVTGVNLSDDFKAAYTEIYIEDSERPVYLYQNLPARFKRDMGDACSVNLYLGRDAVNKSGETALFGLGAATSSETYPLKNVTLGSKLRIIHDNTFAYANQLTGITFADDNCLQAIGAHAFEGVRWNKPITFPSNLKLIGKYAFAENRFLNTVSFSNAPDLTIDEGAFQYCQRLASVNYASKIHRIRKYAFRYCENYCGAIDIKAFEVDESAFERCQFTDLTLNVISLGKNVFRDIQSIRTLRGTIDYVGEGAFAGCNNLTTIDINGNTAIGNGAFGALQKLENVCINIPEIRGGAFYSSTSPSLFPQIKSLTFGNDVTTIGGEAFYGLNKGNTKPCDLTFGNGLKLIEGSAFKQAFVNKVHFAQLENANPQMEIKWSAFENITVDTEILPAVSLGNTVKSIGDSNFNSLALTKPVDPNDVVIDLGSTVESIGYDCCNINTCKTTVTLPGSTKTVGNESFKWFHKINFAPGLSKLTMTLYHYPIILYMPQLGITADSIAVNRDVEFITNEDSKRALFTPGNFWAESTLSFATDKNSTFTGKDFPYSRAKKVVLGKYCKDYPNAVACQEVDIHESVESINGLSLTGSNSNYNWSAPGSRRIVLPASLGKITSLSIANTATDALIISDGTKPLTLGSGPKTGNYLTELYVGRNISYANPNGPGVFEAFPYLEKVVVGPKVSEITRAMFKDCPKLTNIIFGREDAAEGEDAIAEMQLKKIAANAFQNCRGLEVLSLPETLESTGADAFHGFQGLQRIVARSATPALGTVTWGTAIEDNVELYYPQASENKYRASDMFYPFFNAGHAFTTEGNIAESVSVPLDENNVEDLDEIGEGESYNLPSPVALTSDTGSAAAGAPKRRSHILKSPTDAQPELIPVSTKFYWFSPRPDIATVDADGKVTVLKNEPAEIWVYALDGSDRKAVVKINQPVIAGDMNRDGKLNVVDFTSLTMRLANKGRCSKISDVNADGALDVKDATELLMKVSKKQ